MNIFFISCLICGLGLFVSFFLYSFESQLKKSDIQKLINYSLIYVLFSVLILFFINKMAYNKEKYDLEKHVKIYAESLKALNHEKLDLNAKSDNEDYLKLIELEKKWLSQDSDIEDVYTLKLNSKNQLYFVVDSETDYNHDGLFEGDREQRTPIGEIYDKDLSEMKESLLKNEFVITQSVYSDKWGSWMSAFYPILNENNKPDAIIGIDIDSQKFILELLFPDLIGCLFLVVIYNLCLLALKSFIVQSNLNVEVIKSAHEAQRALEVKSKFVATVSHELRTPLNGIIGLINDFDKSRFSDKQSQDFDIILSCSQLLLELINDVLDFSKLESNKLNLKQEILSLPEVVNDSISAVRHRAVQKNIKLEFEIDKSLTDLVLLGDSLRLKQIIINFLSNAVKFTDKGQVSFKVGILHQDEDEVLIQYKVIDTGCGIGFEDQKKLFESFYQADTTSHKKQTGTGLGLSISKILIEKMSGQVMFDSVLNKGTTFVFTTLLHKDKSLPQRLNAKIEMSDTKASEVNKNLKILIVDDVKVNQLVLSRVLDKLGFKYDLASDGAEAYRMHTENNYEIIFMDCRMPVMNGYEAAKVINDYDLHQSRITFIVALTANVGEDDEKLCYEAGMKMFLTKPIKIKDIESVFKEYSRSNMSRYNSVA